MNYKKGRILSSSPEFYFLYLGFINEIKYHLEAPRTTEKLVDAVKKSIICFDLRNVNDVWLPLMNCFVISNVIEGRKNDRIPNMLKQRENQGNENLKVVCDQEIYENRK